MASLAESARSIENLTMEFKEFLETLELTCDSQLKLDWRFGFQAWPSGGGHKNVRLSRQLHQSLKRRLRESLHP